MKCSVYLSWYFLQSALVLQPYVAFVECYVILYWPGSSVGIATDYGMDGPGIESRWRRDFPPVQTGSGAHTLSMTMGTVSFPGVKYGRGVTLTTHPLLVPWSWKSRAIPLLTFWATPGPWQENFTFFMSRCIFDWIRNLGVIFCVLMWRCCQNVSHTMPVAVYQTSFINKKTVVIRTRPRRSLMSGVEILDR